MRAVLAVFAVLPLLLAAPTAAETPHEAFIRRLQEDARRAEAHRYDRDRPSDVAECRARGNAVFGRIEAKLAVMRDCLEARRLRRQGR